MNIIVTGGAGYVGSTLVPMLLKKGHRVTVYDKLYWGVDPLLPVVDNKNLTIIKGDITDRDHLARVMKDKDAIIHLAAIIGVPPCDKMPDKARKTNVDGTKTVVDLKRKEQILIYASTVACYGDLDGICTEESKLNAFTLYGKTKAEAEKMVLPVGGIALRLPTIFGLSPRLRLDLLVNELVFDAVFSKKIEVYRSNVKRTVLHVRDAARAFVLALENAESMSGEAYNVGDEAMIFPKIELAHTVGRFVRDYSIIENNSDAHKDVNYDVSYKKIQAFGYRREITLEDAVSELVQVLPLLSVGDKAKYTNL